MDDTLKRNLRKTGIFMLVTACVPWLCFLLPLIPERYRSTGTDSGWLMVVGFSSILCYLFVLVWGGPRVIWKLPFGKVWRTVLFIAWLIIYPACCLIWLGLFTLCLMRTD